eukprot:TRINITY_DN11585_c0_g1_i2.p1 TRINITY_DN11585_c0_g1~~TRINITY_DN11585_c0_g1_i2.p1  ORF type:complete len:279 (-),score=33.31 TRINITY_DN11585_c0_g1_i2:340-1176(-)
MPFALDEIAAVNPYLLSDDEGDDIPEGHPGTLSEDDSVKDDGESSEAEGRTRLEDALAKRRAALAKLRAERPDKTPVPAQVCKLSIEQVLDCIRMHRDNKGTLPVRTLANKLRIYDKAERRQLRKALKTKTSWKHKLVQIANGDLIGVLGEVTSVPPSKNEVKRQASGALKESLAESKQARKEGDAFPAEALGSEAPGLQAGSQLNTPGFTKEDARECVSEWVKTKPADTSLAELALTLQRKDAFARGHANFNFRKMKDILGTSLALADYVKRRREET